MPYGLDKFTQTNLEGETEENTATGGILSKIYSLLSSLNKTVKKYGNVALGEGIRDLIGGSGEAPNSARGGNKTISSAFKGIPVMTKSAEKLNTGLEKLITNLSKGNEVGSTFSSMGDQLEVLTRHFNMFDEATEKSIKKLKETGEVSKDLETVFKNVSKELKNTSQENLKLLTENLEKTKQTTKTYFLEMSGVAVASIGTATAVMSPLISAGLDQQKQIIELSKATDSLLPSNGNQELFSQVTRNLSATYGIDLQEVRSLFVDTASDLGLSYSEDFGKGFRQVNPELEHYIKQSLILKKTADVEDKTLRGLVKAVKTVGVSSKDASDLVTVFTNSLVSLRANNRFTKQDVEEIAESLEEMITSLGFASGWDKKEIALASTQFTNFTNWLTDKAGEGGKEVAKMFAKNFSNLDNGQILMNVLGMNPVEARELMSKNQFDPIVKQYAVRMDQLNEEIDKIRTEGQKIDPTTGMPYLSNVQIESRITNRIGMLFPEDKVSEKQQRAFLDHLVQMKKKGGFLKNYEELNIAKPLPEAQKKLDEMYDNLAGILAVLSGLKNKFLEVFGGPIVGVIAFFAKQFADIATFLLNIINILPDFVKGIMGIVVGVLTTVGIGSALSNIFNLGTAFKSFISPFQAFMKHIMGGFSGGFFGKGIADMTTGAAKQIAGGAASGAAGEIAGSAIGSGVATAATKGGWLGGLLTKSGIRSLLAVVVPLLSTPPVLAVLAALGWFAYKAYDTYKPVTETTGRDQIKESPPGGFHNLDTWGLRQKKWTEDWTGGRYVNKWQDARKAVRDFFGDLGKNLADAPSNYLKEVSNIGSIVYDSLSNLFTSIGNVISEYWKELADIPSVHAEALKKALGEYWENLKAAPSVFVDALSNIYTIFKENVIDPISNGIKNIIGSLWEKLFGSKTEDITGKGWSDRVWDFFGWNKTATNTPPSSVPEPLLDNRNSWMSGLLGFNKQGFLTDQNMYGFNALDSMFQRSVFNPAGAPFNAYQPTLTPASAVTAAYPEIKAEFTPNVRDNKEASVNSKEMIDILKRIADNTQTSPTNKSYSMFSPRSITENESLTLGKIDLADRSGMG